MAWTATFKMTAGNDKTGHAVALWDGAEVYSRAMDMTAADGLAFAAEARAALTKRNAETTSEATVAARLTTELNK